MMRFALLMSVMLFLAALSMACGGRPRASARIAAALPIVSNGTVALSPESPMLGQLRRTAVAVADLPTDEVVAPGKIDANPNRVSKVVLPVVGRVAGVFVKVGDAVRKGEPLLAIDSPDADAAMSAYLSAAASATQAEAALSKARADYERSADLFEHNAVARKDVLAADTARAQAGASVEQARAALDQARRRLTVLGLTPGDPDQHVLVRSPLAGKVLELSVVPGEFRNDTSTAVMTIADLSTVWVSSQVPETSIRFVQVGERVDITLMAYPGEHFEGRVSRIADTVDPQTRTIKVQAEMDNRDGRFRPEMYGSIHHIESTERLPVVPAAAVVRSGSHSVVFVETAPGRFEQRAVNVGRRAGDVVRVTSGIKAGDVIVVDGAMLLEGLLRQGPTT